jgi:CelD/BcsL family acetyltransferase involved in cellulose biosynthesis
VSAQCEIITCDDHYTWDKVVSECPACDFYHTASYHLLHTWYGQGRAVLLAYRESNKVAALPLLIRSLDDVDGLSHSLCILSDATSVYGYSGPIANVAPEDAEFLRHFNRAVLNSLTELKVIAAFSRLHPLLENHRFLPEVGQVSDIGLTVSIDLTLPLATQRARYRKDHKYGINKARRTGVIAYCDAGWKHYDDFLRLYALTMQRTNADEAYHFDRSYFDQLRRALESKLHLFVAELQGRVVSAGLFSLFQNIVQFHLSGSDPEYLHYAPSKVLIDQVRIWASSQGAKIFHLGGGVGSKRDSLFMFKAGFSDRYHEFKVWKCIVDDAAYNQAINERKTKNNAPPLVSSSYFPAYRSPI